MKYTHTYIRIIQEKKFNYYSISCFYKEDVVFQYVTSISEDNFLKMLNYSVRHKKLYLDNRNEYKSIIFKDNYLRTEYSIRINNTVNSRFYWIFKEVREE